jgi:hypothetical protein
VNRVADFAALLAFSLWFGSLAVAATSTPLPLSESSSALLVLDFAGCAACVCVVLSWFTRVGNPRSRGVVGFVAVAFTVAVVLAELWWMRPIGLSLSVPLGLHGQDIARGLELWEVRRAVVVVCGFFVWGLILRLRDTPVLRGDLHEHREGPVLDFGTAGEDS